MQDLRLRFGKRKTMISALAAIIAVNLITLLVIMNLNDSWYQDEIIETTDNYIVFQQQVISLMETGTDLLRGYEAYIQVSGALSNDDSKRYLDFLTADEMSLIRNIGIIRDTTIIYNHPLEGNEASIGVDLSKIEGQSEVILATKNKLTASFQGPVNLVQGGRGYIMRKPLLNISGEYWGQVSIVLKADVIEETIKDYAVDNGLTVLIYEDLTHEVPILGDQSILENKPLSFSLNSDLNDWVFYVTPMDGWNSYRRSNVILFVGGFLLSLLLGITVYYIRKVNFSLQNALAHDHLTGIYNRHYLEVVQKRLFTEERGEENRFGMLHIDLDYFKSINDLYGHEAGDRVLIETAEILKKLTRNNELVFRVGGDEFLILLPWIRNKVALMDFKVRLEKDFSDQYSLRDVYDIDIGPSIGAGAFPEDGNTFDEVLGKADEDMYEEKGKKKRR